MKLRVIVIPNMQRKIHKYECIELLGKGKFGIVYKGKHEKTGNYVAIKMECQCNLHILKHETTMLNYLYGKKVVTIPNIYWFGLIDNIHYLVMSYYDCSLYDFIHMGDNNNNIPDIIQSLLRSLYSVHEAGVVHRDIKPQNFMLKNNNIFIIDFGMATFYVDEQYHHISESTDVKQHVMGTLKYISYNVHSGILYTRRDDIISIAYIYMWLHGVLFWNTEHITSSDLNDSVVSHSLPETHILYPANKYIHRQKEISYIKEYFYNTGFNNTVLLSFVEYAYNLTFNETPNYSLNNV